MSKYKARLSSKKSNEGEATLKGCFTILGILLVLALATAIVAPLRDLFVNFIALLVNTFVLSNLFLFNIAVIIILFLLILLVLYIYSKL